MNINEIPVFDKAKEDRPSDELLEKFFDNEELSKEEFEKIEKYRNACIKEVSKKATTYNEIPTDFSRSSLENMSSLIEDYYGELNQKSFDEDERKEFFRGKDIIDLGAGPYPVDNVFNFLMWGADKYIGVDANESLNEKAIKEYIEDSNKGRKQKGWMYVENFNIESVKKDSLEYLMTVPENSAFIISNGFLVLGEVIPKNQKGEDYLKFIAKEIARITPEKGFTYHSFYDKKLLRYLSKYFELKNEDLDHYALWAKKEEVKK